MSNKKKDLEHAAERRRRMLALVDEVQEAALKRLLELAPKIDGIDAETLINAVVKLGDMKMAIRWTSKLSEAIKKNPSLLPKGAPGRLTAKVAGAAQQHIKILAGDQREQAARTRKRVLGNLGEQDLPKD